MSEHPVGGVDYPRTVLEFQDWFATDVACLEFLERLRWPDGVRVSEVWRGRARVAHRGRSLDVPILRSADECDGGHSFRSVPVTDAVVVPRGLVHHLAEDRGFGAESAARARAAIVRDGLGVDAQVRRAMIVPGRKLLHGGVELDETYVGGVSRGSRGPR